MIAIFFSCTIHVAQLESKFLVPVSWLKDFFICRKKTSEEIRTTTRQTSNRETASITGVGF